MKNGVETLVSSRTENEVLLQRIAELENCYLYAERELSRLRKQEENLLERTHFLQNVIDHLPVSVFMKDVHSWQFVLWNTTMEKFVGLTEEQVLGKTDYDFFPQEQADFFRQKDTQTIQSGNPEFIPEESVNSPTLGTRRLSTTKIPMYDTTGTPLYLLGISEDITDLKQSDEDALTFKTLVENAPDAVLLTNTTRVIVYANPAAQSLFGYGEDMVGMHMSTLYAEEEHERQSVILKELRDNGVWQGNVRSHRKDGHTSICQVSAFIVRNSDGTVRGNAIIVRDISDMKQVEKRLQQFQTMVEHAPDGIALINLDQTVAYANPSMRAMLQLDDDAVGLDTSPMFADPPEYLAQMRTGYLTYGTWKGTVTMRRKDGTIFPGQSSVFVTKEPESHTPQMLAVILRDMTEQNRMDEKLRLREAILSVVGNSAEQFLRTNDMGHHIQTMLEQLGKAVNVSRVYLFENHTDAQGTLLTNQRYEWTADGIEAQIDNPDLQNLSYVNAGLERWSSILSQGQTIYGNVATFPASEREILGAQGILSVICVPIFVAGSWWGFIGFDGCEYECDWSSVEVDALKAASSILGSAMQRRQDEERQNELQQQIIEAQRVALRELSTPMMPLVEGVVAMPLVGTVDTTRALQVMETLLEGVAQHQANIAILDITGVPVVDTQVANALIQAAQAVRLLGAQVILTGIGPTMAQTLVTLGVDLKGITTYSSLQSAMTHALKYQRSVR